jgi:hypothetical protein
MRKEQVRKNPRETSLTPQQDDNASKSLELSEGQLEVHFRRLNLAHTRRVYKEVADRAEKEGWSYRDFPALRLAEEVARRKQPRLQRCTRSAHFPFFKTIDEFDFASQSTLRESVIGSCLGLDFVTEGRSLILHGKTSRGKTHLAVRANRRRCCVLAAFSRRSICRALIFNSCFSTSGRRRKRLPIRGIHEGNSAFNRTNQGIASCLPYRRQYG